MSNKTTSTMDDRDGIGSNDLPGADAPHTRVAGEDAPRQVAFIVGVARSGTSFIHRIINRHPDVRISYEGHLFTEGWECYRRGQPFDTPTRFNKLLDQFVECDSDQRRNQWLVANILANREQLWHEYQQRPSFAALLEQIYQIGGDVTCWGNKILRSEHCERILENFPSARFVVLVRDPRAVYASQKRFFTGMRIGYSAIYTNQHYRWVEDVASRDRGRYFVIRYEQFVREPGEALRTIFEFLGVESRESVDSILRTDPPHADSLDKWASQLKAAEIQQIESLCFDRMRRMGYTPSMATSQRALTVARRAFELLLEFSRNFSISPATWRRKRLWQRFLQSLAD
jgi:hypothetical protein